MTDGADQVPPAPANAPDPPGRWDRFWARAKARWKRLWVWAKAHTRLLVLLLGFAVLAGSVYVNAQFPEHYNDVQSLRPWVLEQTLLDPHCADACPPTPPPCDDGCIGANIQTFQDGVSNDWWFMASYGAAGVLIALGALGRRRRRACGVAVGAFVIGVGFDLVETLCVNDALDQAADRVELKHRLFGLDLGSLPQVTRGFSTAKWTSLFIAIGVVLWFVASTSPPVDRWRGRKQRSAEVYGRQPRPEKADPEAPHPWDPPPATVERVGVCCSGGGTRSASFSLGALQALQETGQLEKTDYLAAASGGGYISAGLTVSQANADIWQAVHPVPDPTLAFAATSPETAFLRRHSSYLLPDLWKGTTAVARLIGGLFVNLMVVSLVLLAVARPVGWLISELHPERQAVLPVAVAGDDDEAEVDIGAVAELEPIQDDAGALVRRWSVTLVAAEEAPSPEADDGVVGTAEFDVLPFGLADEALANVDQHYGVEPDGVGIVELRDGKAAVVRQPTVQVDETGCDDLEVPDPGTITPPLDSDGVTHTLGCSLAVDRQPTLKFDDDVFGTPPVATDVVGSAVDPEETLASDTSVTTEVSSELTTCSAGAEDAASTTTTDPPETDPEATCADAATADLLSELEIDDQPRLTSETGLNGREDITIDGWIWWTVAATTGVAVLGSLAIMLFRIRWKPRMKALAVAWLVAFVVFMVLVGLPWLDQELFPGASRLASGQPLGGGGGSGGTPWWKDQLAPVGGVLALVATAVGRFFTSNQSSTGGEAAKSEGSVVGRVWAKLRARNKELGWYELSATKIVAGIAVLLGAMAIFVEHLQFASANGYDGQLMGTSLLRGLFGGPGHWLPEWQKLAVVLVVLIGFQRLIDAQASSIYPYYKQRLSGAFLLKRTGEQEVRAITYEEPVPFDKPWERATGEPVPPARSGPKLVLCCAVNLSEVGAVPPGRKAGSFTFSATEIGGPEVGYLSYEEYWKAMSKARQHDLTVPAAMAISGAAFSPAMGKKNLGPVGALFALANLRLGVWLPHPKWVETNKDKTWRHHPGWSWFGREILNRYKARSQFVYVSDGGHWENLGLVELLRRGCTRIVCINAGGDGQDSFGTIGEAMALAREELGVEFDPDFDPSPLRPPTKASEKARLLRRQESRDKPTPLATASFVTGTYTLPLEDGVRTGHIWLIEPALTADMPFDVQVFAESEAIFPDDSTADLVYNHRQFEAFRALGHHQAGKAIADMTFSPEDRAKAAAEAKAAKKDKATDDASEVADVAGDAAGGHGVLSAVSAAIAAALKAAEGGGDP